MNEYMNFNLYMRIVNCTIVKYTVYTVLKYTTHINNYEYYK